MIRKTNTKKKTEIQTQRQIQRQTHTHRYGEIPNTQSQKDPNAKSQMLLFRLPGFWGEKFVYGKIDISASGSPF